MKIETEVAIHKGTKIIKLLFDYDVNFVAKIRAIPNTRWSRSMRCWYIPYGQKNIQLLNQTGIPIRPKEIDTKPPTPTTETLTPFPSLLLRFGNYMRERRYSPRTIDAYTECLRIFFNYHSQKDILEIDNGDVSDFNRHYILERKLSATYQTQFIKAIQLFYEKIPRKKLILAEIERPRKGRFLPRVLSKEDVGRIIGSTTNLKHRAMLSMIYACGLRRSELLNMKIADVDSKRKVIVIRRGKGDKDRIVPLSEKILTMLREYFKLYRPQTWLFEGQTPNTPYSEGSLQKVFMQAKERAGIKVSFTLHCLRHCYATHLLEAGTDLRYIQELLGHKHCSTTEIYTHVSTRSIQQIKSPFDDLDI